MKGLTKRQREVIAAIQELTESLGYSPSVRELCERLKVASTCTVQKHLVALIKKGYLVKQGGKSRTLQIAIPGGGSRRGIVPVPLLGRVAAGQPMEAIENIEDYLPLSRELVGADKVFLLRVRGDSMIGDGIADGDLIVVRRQNSAEEGEIVVAIMDGEATVKHVYRDGYQFRLEASNPAFGPIAAPHVDIVGRVIMCLHRL